MIELEKIHFAYPHSTFSLGIDMLVIPKHQTTAIIGPSGFGKTTLLNLLAGILAPDKGAVVINDTRIDLLSDDAKREFRIKHIGFVFQDFRLLEYLNVADNIKLPYRINRALSKPSDLDVRVSLLASQLGIKQYLKQYPAALSQGEKQRLAIARALVTNPEIILADEATGNLDPENKQLILDLLLNEARERQAALVAVTHDHGLLTHFDQVIDFAEQNFAIK